MSLKTSGLLIQVWLLKALVTSKADCILMNANCCNMSIVFHENGTILKMKGKEFEETIMTINLSYFIIKFKILVH